MVNYGLDYVNTNPGFGMGFGADSQDMFDEEERKRRRKEQEEAAARAGNTEVATTEVKQYADGSQTQTTTQEIPAAAGPVAPQAAMTQAAPAAPTAEDIERQRQAELAQRQAAEDAQARAAEQAAQPRPQVQQPQAVRPVNPFQQIVYQESRGRDFDAQGRPLRSPAGALYSSQVMPATAAAPGYGIRPAQSQTPEEYNRVGREYYGKLQEKYGDNTLAAAAYHSGPGNVDKALAWSKQTGQDWRQAPTMGPAGRAYAAEFQRSPAGQPASPAMAQAQPAAQAPVEKTPLQLGQERYYANQDNMKELVNMRDDQNVPEYLRRRASDRVMTMLVNQNEQRKAEGEVKKALSEGNNKVLADTMAGKRNGLGDWAEFILLGFLSPELAAKKAIAMDIAPTKWQQTTIRDAQGNEIPVEVELRADGRIRSGYMQDENQTPLTKEQIGQAASGISVSKGVKPDAGATYEKKDANGNIIARGRLITEYRNNRANTYIDLGGGKRAEYTPEWQQERVGTAAAVANINLVTDLKKKHGTNVLDAEKDFVALNGPFGSPTNPASREQFRQAYGFGEALPSGTVGGVPAQGGGVPMPSGVLQPIAGQKEAIKVGTEVTTAEQKGFVKYKDETLLPAAANGQKVSDIRREQLRDLLVSPGVIGLMQNQGGAYREAQNLLRDMISGNFRDSEEVSSKIANLNLTQPEKDVLYNFNMLNAQVNPLTLKQTAGPGAVSEAEQRLNQAANVDIRRAPVIGAFTQLTRSKFTSDLEAYKADWLAQRPDIKTTAQFQTAWSAEERRLRDQYNNIYAERAKYIGKNGSTPNAGVAGFKYYPVPAYNPQTKRWELEGYSAKAARPPISSFVR